MRNILTYGHDEYENLVHRASIETRNRVENGSAEVEMISADSLILTHTSVAKVLQCLRETTNWPQEGAQIELVESLSTHLEEFPLSKRYFRNLVKTLHKEVENSPDCDFSDEFTEFVLGVLATSKAVEEDEDDEAYFSYLVPVRGWSSKEKDTAAVPLRCLRQHNLVGMRVWTAGMALTELLVGPGRELIEGKNVLELGAGVGTTGVVVSASVKMSSLLLTDFAENILENLQHNVSINRERCLCEEEVRVKMLDWRGTSSKEDIDYLYSDQGDKRAYSDVIIAADCTYAEDINSSLAQCIETFLQAKGAAGVAGSADAGGEEGWEEGDSPVSAVELQRRHGTVAIVAGEERSESTYDHFLQVLGASESLAHQEVTDWAIASTEDQRLYEYDRRDKLHFVVIWLKQ